MYIEELIQQLQKAADILGTETKVFLETENKESEIVSLSFRKSKSKEEEYELIIEGVSFYFYKN